MPTKVAVLIAHFCKVIKKCFETAAQTAKCFQNPRKPPRALRNAFRDVGNLYVQQNKGGTLHLLNHPTLTEGSPFADLN